MDKCVRVCPLPLKNEKRPGRLTTEAVGIFRLVRRGGTRFPGSHFKEGFEHQLTADQPFPRLASDGDGGAIISLPEE